MPVCGGWMGGKIREEPEVSFDYVKTAAMKTEELGFDSIWVPDHMLNTIKGERAPVLEAWTTLTALAALTQRVTIGHTAICQGFRYPAVLAKMGATLADVSKGRFVLSMGAGWFEREFEAYGVPWHDHDIRVARTREQIEIIKSLWTKETTNYEGSFFKIKDGILEPKPNPPPEIWYAGESEASRKLVADLADCWLMRGTSPERLQKKTESIQPLLGGRRIQYAVPAPVFIGETDEEAKGKLKKFLGGDRQAADRVLETGLVGVPETVTERIRAFKEAGADHLLLLFSRTVEDIVYFGERIAL